MRVFLETERMRLRRFTESDANDLATLDGDPEVMRFLGNGRPVDPAVTENETLPRLIADYARYGGLGVWAAERKQDAEFLGWFELRPAADGPVDEVELGYRLRPACWGQGLATEGARALVRTAFTDLGIERVFATTMAVNRASRRVLEKVGLRYVRTFHLDWPEPIAGTEHGEVEYELLKGEWYERS